MGMENRNVLSTFSSKRILEKLIFNTESKEFKWVNTVETDDRLEFKYNKKITDKKNLTFELTMRRRMDESDLTIRFGPVKNNTSQSFLYYITMKTQPILRDLIDAVNDKHNQGYTG